jgi:Cof subfamily protein (haloacid dehalogenase superfamily)
VIDLFNKAARRKTRLANISLLSCDLDGTLLNEENAIPKKALDLFHSLEDLGIKTILASGRSAAFTQLYANQIGTKLPVISINGGLITNESTKPVYCSIVPKGIPALISEFERENKCTFHVTVFTASGLHSNLESALVPKYLRTEENMRSVSEDLTSYEDGTALIVLYGRYMEIQNLSVKLAQKYKGLIRRVLYPSKQQPEFSYIEIQHSKTNKGKALAQFCKENSIPSKNVAAIGDFVNDIEMLSYAGYSAAMANAIDEVKNSCDFVTERSNSEGGISEFLELIINARQHSA